MRAIQSTICTGTRLTTHKKLTQGTFRPHEDGVRECGDCFKPAPIKVYLDDEDKVRGINRTHFCGDLPVEFSIGLMTHSTVRGKEVDIFRACSSHANYHLHRWHHLKVNETLVRPMYPLDSQDDVMRAFAHASANVFPRYEEWRQEWAKKL